MVVRDQEGRREGWKVEWDRGITAYKLGHEINSFFSFSPDPGPGGMMSGEDAWVYLTAWQSGSLGMSRYVI